MHKKTKISLFLIFALFLGSVFATPPGPLSPVPLGCDFTEPEGISAGKPFTVTITVSAVLFDIGEIEVTSFATEKLKIVSGGAVWKGPLKKGQKKSISFSLLAPQKGFNGIYGLEITSAFLYKELEEYINKQPEHERPYHLEYLQWKKKSSPRLYKETLDGVIDIS